MAMASIDDWKTALLVKVALIDDDEKRLMCTVLVDQAYDALVAQSRAVDSDIASYSIQGRSVTRRNMTENTATYSRLMRQIRRMLYGITTVSDFSESPENLRIS